MLRLSLLTESYKISRATCLCGFSFWYRRFCAFPFLMQDRLVSVYTSFLCERAGNGPIFSVSARHLFQKYEVRYFGARYYWVELLFWIYCISCRTGVGSPRLESILSQNTYATLEYSGELSFRQGKHSVKKGQVKFFARIFIKFVCLMQVFFFLTGTKVPEEMFVGRRL
jgi:hypothetical protein